VNSFIALGGLTIGRDDVSLYALKEKEEIAYWTIAHDAATSKPYVNVERGGRSRNKNKFAAKPPSQNMGEDDADAGGSDMETVWYDNELRTGSKRKTVANGFDDVGVDSPQQGLRVSTGGGRSGRNSRKKRRKEHSQMLRMFRKLQVEDGDGTKSDPVSE